MYATHFLVAFGGGWGSDAGEVWQCGVRGNPGAGFIDTFDEDTYLSEIEAALSSWFSNSDNGMANQANLQWVKCNKIGPDGRYVDPTTHVFDYVSPPPGGSAIVAPGFTSLAYTWGTTHTRGTGTYGRIYPPNSTYAMGGAFNVSTASTNANRAAGLALLNVLNNHSSTTSEFGPEIASKKDASLTAISRVSSDNIYDVQRRRKNRATSTRSDWVAFTP